MKVVCIDDIFISKQDGRLSENAPSISEIVTVIGQYNNGYFLLEYPTNFGRKCVWNKSKFIPISEIDETEFERNYTKKEITEDIPVYSN